MINVESKIFTEIARALRDEFPGVLIAGEYVNAPAKFPFVSVVEVDNYVYSRGTDSAERERYAQLLYEVNVYSNREGTKKNECRKILQFIDEMMYGMNFIRISMNPVPNMEDATIYRLNARYEVVSDGKTMYRK